MQAKGKFLGYARNGLQVYVDSVAGDDVLGTGNLLQPYQTLQAALAAIALLPLGNYVIELAAGNYAGAPITWPTQVGKNISMYGSGVAVTSISTNISFTSLATEQDQVVFSDFSTAGGAVLTFDFTLAAVSTVILQNGSYQFNRVDTLAPGPQALRAWNSLITSFSTSSVVIMDNCEWVGGPTNVISATGLALMNGCLFASMVAVVDGTLELLACITGGTSITGTGTIATDASSTQNATITGPTLSFNDDASKVAFEPGVPGNWPVAPTEVAQALDELAAATSSAVGKVVFQPGGTAGDGIYITWADAYAAISAQKGPRTLYIDDTITSPAVITAGTYDLTNVCLGNGNPLIPATVQVNDAVVLTNLFQINSLNMNFLNTAPVVSVTAPSYLRVDNGANISANGTAPIWDLSAGSPLLVLMTNFTKFQTGGSGGTVINVQAGQLAEALVIDGSNIGNDSISGDVTGSFFAIVLDSSDEVGTQAGFAGTFSIALETSAAREGYSPAVPGNWPVAPTQVAEALDELAVSASAKTEFVFQPGGTDGGNIYTTWAALYAALSPAAGPKTIYFDDSIVSPAVIPAGAYALDEVTFDAAVQGKFTQVQVADGATWTNLRIINNLNISFLNSGIVESPGAVGIKLQGTTIAANGSAQIWEVTAGLQIQLLQGSSLTGTVGVACVNIETNETLQLVLASVSSINNLAISSPAADPTATLVILRPDETGGFVAQGAQFGGSVTDVPLQNAVNLFYSPGVPGNWPTPPIQVAQALDELAARSGGNSVTFKPGGTNAGSVFNTFAAAYAAAIAIPGPVNFYIDSSITSPAVMPVGAYDFANIKLFGAQVSQLDQLQIVDGVFIANFNFVQDLDIETLNSQIIDSITANTFINLDNAHITNHGTAPIWDATTSNGGKPLFVLQRAASFAPGSTFPVLNIDSGQTVIIAGFTAGSTADNTISGDGTTTLVAVLFDPNGGFSPVGYGGSYVPLLNNSAGLLAYSPGTPGNWPTPPGQVAQALDELATNQAQAKGVATLAAGTVTVNTAAVTAGNLIFLTLQSESLGFPAAIGVSARIPGTSFTITSANVADASDVAWMIIPN